MPQMNGEFHRTFSSAARAAKEQEGGGEGEQPKMEAAPKSGRAMMIHEHSPGKFKTKSRHHDGKVTEEQHGSHDEMMNHVADHFGGQGPQENEEDYDGADGMSMHSIV